MRFILTFCLCRDFFPLANPLVHLIRFPSWCYGSDEASEGFHRGFLDLTFVDCCEFDSNGVYNGSS